MRNALVVLAAAVAMAGCSKAKAENGASPEANSPSGQSMMQTKPSQPAPAGSMNGDTQAGQMQGVGESGAMPGDKQAANETSGRGTMGSMPMEMFTPQMTLEKIHALNQEEIDAGKMAKKNGTKVIDSYAERLIKDHEKGDKEVMSVAKKLKIDVKDPDKVSWPQSVQQQMQASQQMMKQLHDMKGNNFDKQFLTMMDEGHERALDFLKQAQTNVQDEQVKRLITQLEPTIQEHKKLAEELMNRVGAKVQGRR